MPQRKNILLVDDSEKITSLMKLFLINERGIKNIETANTLEDAEAFIALSAIDVVVLDIHFSRGSGMKLLKRLALYHPYIVTIVLTNHSDSFFKELSEKAGAGYFLDKSTEFEQVPGIISKLPIKPLLQ